MVKADDWCSSVSDVWHGAWKNSSTQRRYIAQIHYQSRRFYGSYGKARAVFNYSEEVLRTATNARSECCRSAFVDKWLGVSFNASSRVSDRRNNSHQYQTDHFQ